MHILNKNQIGRKDNELIDLSQKIEKKNNKLKCVLVRYKKYLTLIRNNIVPIYTHQI